MFHRMMNYGELEARPTVVLTKELIKKSLPKYRRHDDLLLIQESAWDEFKRSLPIPVVKEENSPFSIDEDELASLVCQTVQKPICRRLAVDKGVRDDDFRSPNVELILGDDGLVNHRDNHILYQFDVTKCMFSFGNVHEKMRMAQLDCSDEVVVDLFAGIGYFTLPLLVHAKAKHLYACEWNPDSIRALKKNLTLNKIDATRYTVLEGDNRSNRPTDVAQRVLLGILPSCSGWMQTALECVDKKTGAMLHCHDLVDTKSARETTTTATKQNQAEANDEDSPTTKAQTTPDSQSLFNQSLTSSSSSHSTIERLSAPTSSSSMDHDKLMTQSSESDKDTNSPVLLEKPTNCSMSGQNTSSSSSGELNNSVGNSSNSNKDEPPANNSSNNPAQQPQQQSDEEREESVELPPEQIPISDIESSLYEARGLALIESIRSELDSHDLSATIVHIQPVKSYAPLVNHVVFDIKIEPKPRS